MSFVLGATVATLVLVLVSFAVYRLREARRLRRPARGWTMPDEADGTLRPILFERVDLDEVDDPGPRRRP